MDEFAPALLDPDRTAPPGLRSAFRHDDAGRFAVYRNNVASSLIRALGEIFPATRRIVGDRFFDAMAHAFIVEHPPRSPLLFRYGAGFPDFVEVFKPARRMPYLADLARLEKAWLDAWHAADAESLDGETVAAIPIAQLPFCRLIAHPAARIVGSRFAIADLFHANREGTGPSRIDASVAQTVLVARPAYAVTATTIAEDEAVFIRSLIDGHPLEAAAAEALACKDDFDLGASLTLVLRSGAFQAVRETDR
ncbi:DNA-binding domain-containing protein [Mesorhizobium sp. YIM 152430]|uniref:HvfC/BufC N-terminal domain-containing protein n=1 Tax=Mesorhizobium sp. YIM 152430 TaxID=3031761 RepID=UPI0023DCC594|nr:DNA-binding domain-containing protein [Mesorhizobium sp. YIM 152430]MDF1601818.1 DNA-binding domain-containing protein [Mesorhizobium sp. YIM 152430]